ncbi:MAG: hypothetical protein ACOYJC_10465 [Christensenellales bacterium]|jgi:hypothetical protein
MRIKTEEIGYLRELAKYVRDIAHNPIWDEKRQLWKDKNALKKVRPLILAALPTEAWDEIMPADSLRIQDPFFQAYEKELRKRIYKYEKLRDDEILHDKLYVPIHYTLTDWCEDRKRPYSGDSHRAAEYMPCIEDLSDFKHKIKRPEITDVDWDTSNKDHEEVMEVFGDYLTVELGQPLWGCTDHAVKGAGGSIIDILCEIRGYENILYDMVDEPEFVHDAMAFMADAYMHYFNQLEEYRLLRLNNNEFMNWADTPLLSNGLACTDELPPEGFDPSHIKTKDLWGYSMAQEFTIVSPEMLQEFVLPYQASIAQRFGLNCYGCCESMDTKWDMIMDMIPHLRELSVTYTCDIELAADKLKNDYVFSWKPNTTTLITLFDEKALYEEMKRGFDIAKDCCLIASLRDTQSLYGEPHRATRWVDISMDLAQQYA